MSSGAARGPVTIFISYSHEDEEMRVALEKHLGALLFQKRIDLWHDRKIAAGDRWQARVDEKLCSAEIVLLLISASFIASAQCQREVSLANEQARAGKTRVVPVRLRECEWSVADLQTLQTLPKDAKPIAEWIPIDKGYADAAKGIGRIVAELVEAVPSPAPQSSLRSVAPRRRRWWLVLAGVSTVVLIVAAIQSRYARAVEEGNHFLDVDRAANARTAFERALTFWPFGEDARFGREKARVWGGAGLDRGTLEGELAALSLSRPDDPHVLVLRGNVLHERQRFQEARALYVRASEASPRVAEAWFGLGNVDTDLSASDLHPDERLTQAIDFYQKAIEISYSTAKYHNNRAELLERVGRLQEAIDEYRRVDDKYPLARLELARLYWREGEFSLAAGEQRAALEKLADPAVAAAENARRWELGADVRGEPIRLENASKACYARLELVVSLFLGGVDGGKDEARRELREVERSCRADVPKLRLAVSADLDRLNGHRAVDIVGCKDLLRGEAN